MRKSFCTISEKIEAGITKFGTGDNFEAPFLTLDPESQRSKTWGKEMYVG